MLSCVDIDLPMKDLHLLLCDTDTVVNIYTKNMHKWFVKVVCLLVAVSVVSCRKAGEVIVLDDNNWRRCLEGQWMLKFYAPWCPACKANEADYKSFAEWSEDLQINVAMVDITKEAGLSGRFMVTALPTFYFGKDGEFWRYSGQRTSDAMHDFVDSRLWKTTEPVWWVRHPDSIQMTMMSWLFKTSVIMKNVHDSLTEKYGLSTWMSYAVFGVGTVVTGLVLGLILVCIVDIISPTKPNRIPATAEGPFRVPENIKEDEGKEEKERKEKRGRESEEEEGTEDNGSAATTEDEEERASQHSQESGGDSQASHASQEWETIHDLEVADAIPDTDKTEGTQVRQRKTAQAPEKSPEDGAGEAGESPKSE